MSYEQNPAEPARTELLLLTAHCSWLIAFKSIRRSGGDRLNNLRRQPEADVLGHDFEFLNIVEPFVTKVRHRFLDEMFWRRRACGEGDCLYALQPAGFNVIAAVN